eukprot:gene11235-23488_t
MPISSLFEIKAEFSCCLLSISSESSPQASIPSASLNNNSIRFTHIYFSRQLYLIVEIFHGSLLVVTYSEEISQMFKLSVFTVFILSCTKLKAFSDQCQIGNYRSTTSSECNKCPVGTFCPTNFCKDSCLKCTPGTYNPLVEQSECLYCPEGTFSDGISVYIVKSCELCLPGSFTETKGSRSCNQCPMGTYNSNYGQSKCTLCPRDTYNPNIGSSYISSCYTCPNNTISYSGSPICCPKGTYLKPGLSPSCESCPQGFFVNPSGGFTCTPCASGSSSEPFSTDCYPCPINTYSHAGSVCTPCKAGTTSILGSSYCIHNTHTSTASSTTMSHKNKSIDKFPFTYKNTDNLAIAGYVAGWWDGVKIGGQICTGINYQLKFKF